MRLDWPEYPRVSIKDETILILFENGKTLFWGVEEDPAKREKNVSDIQEGLRAIKFLSDSLEEFVKSLYAFLAERGFSDTQKDENLRDAIHSYISNVNETNSFKEVKTNSHKNMINLFFIR